MENVKISAAWMHCACQFQFSILVESNLECEHVLFAWIQMRWSARSPRAIILWINTLAIDFHEWMDACDATCLHLITSIHSITNNNIICLWDTNGRWSELVINKIRHFDKNKRWSHYDVRMIDELISFFFGKRLANSRSIITALCPKSMSAISFHRFNFFRDRRRSFDNLYARMAKDKRSEACLVRTSFGRNDSARSDEIIA